MQLRAIRIKHQLTALNYLEQVLLPAKSAELGGGGRVLLGEQMKNCIFNRSLEERSSTIGEQSMGIVRIVVAVQPAGTRLDQDMGQEWLGWFGWLEKPGAQFYQV